MNSKRFRSIYALSLGKMGGAFFGFLRNIIIARLIGVEDFGIAAVFSIIIFIVECSSDLALDRLIVQADDGNSDRLLGSAHFLQFIKGILTGLVLFLFSGLIVSVFSIPEAKWAIQLLALSPIIRGFVHFDVARKQRDRNFLPLASVEFFPHALACIAAVPLCYIFQDYSASLYTNLLHVFLYTAVSHISAEKKYRWYIAKEHLIRILTFSYPLMINGVLLSIANQGDRFLIGNKFGVEVLGWFSTAFNLTYLAASMLIMLVQSYFLPFLSEVKYDSNKYNERANFVFQISFVCSLALISAGVFAGPSFLLIIYGMDYSQGATVIGLLAVMQGFKMARSGFNTAAMAIAKTKLIMLATFARLSGFLIAIIVVYIGGSIENVIWCGIIGEVIGLTFIFVSLVKNSSLNFNNTIYNLAFMIIMIVLSFHLSGKITFDGSLFSQLLFGIFLSLFVCLLYAFFLANIRGKILGLLR